MIFYSIFCFWWRRYRPRFQPLHICIICRICAQDNFIALPIMCDVIYPRVRRSRALFLHFHDVGVMCVKSCRQYAKPHTHTENAHSMTTEYFELKPTSINVQHILQIKLMGVFTISPDSCTPIRLMR